VGKKLGKKTVKNSSALYARLLPSLLDENVLYKTLKGSISASYLEPLKGYSYTLKKRVPLFYIEPWGSILGQ